MHLDTVFAVVDVDAVTVYPRVADAIRAYSLRPSDKEDGGLCIREEESFLDAAQDPLAVPELRVMGTGGDECQAEWRLWDDGNNLLAIEPVAAYLKNEYDRPPTARGRDRGCRDRRIAARTGQGRRTLHDVPALTGWRLRLLGPAPRFQMSDPSTGGHA